MKGVNVVEVGTHPEEEVEFGTRGLCFSHVIRDNPYMVLEFPDGKKVRYDTYYYGSWGDYFESKVDNAVDFSSWLSEEDLFDEDFEALKNGDGQHLLISLIEEYNYRSEEDDE